MLTIVSLNWHHMEMFPMTTPTRPAFPAALTVIRDDLKSHEPMLSKYSVSNGNGQRRTPPPIWSGGQYTPFPSSSSHPFQIIGVAVALTGQALSTRGCFPLALYIFLYFVLHQGQILGPEGKGHGYLLKLSGVVVVVRGPQGKKTLKEV